MDIQTPLFTGPDNADHVVVVVDDHALSRSLKFALELEGFSVEAHGSAEDLLEVGLPSTDLCLVVDYRLPRLNGLQLLTLLMRRHGPIPALLLITHPSEEVGEQALALGVGVIEKPLMGDVLTAAIRSSLARARA